MVHSSGKMGVFLHQFSESARESMSSQVSELKEMEDRSAALEKEQEV